MRSCPLRRAWPRCCQSHKLSPTGTARSRIAGWHLVLRDSCLRCTVAACSHQLHSNSRRGRWHMPSGLEVIGTSPLGKRRTRPSPPAPRSFQRCSCVAPRLLRRRNVQWGRRSNPVSHLRRTRCQTCLVGSWLAAASTPRRGRSCRPDISCTWTRLLNPDTSLLCRSRNEPCVPRQRTTPLHRQLQSPSPVGNNCPSDRGNTLLRWRDWWHSRRSLQGKGAARWLQLRSKSQRRRRGMLSRSGWTDSCLHRRRCKLLGRCWR